MLLIQSQSNDLSTDGVLVWLNYLYPVHPIVRINGEKVIEEINYHISDETNLFEFNVDGHKFNSHRLPNRWYRRGSFNINKAGFKNGSFDEYYISLLFQDYLRQEHTSFHDVIDNGFSDLANSINKFNDNKKGKLENIAKAKEAGLSIPATLFTNSPQKLLAFIDIHEKVITKANHNNRLGIVLDTTVIKLSSDTKIVNKEDVEHLISERGDSFQALPSLYQEYIDKKYELRIFFLAGKLFAMAIFSQTNEKTKIDYRNYDDKRPNRCVPYNLPESIAEKIIDFMRLIDMNCGSIDMIYTPKGEYIFLEVNPIGHFHWLDKNCNYFLEREIANFLQNEQQQKWPG